MKTIGLSLLLALGVASNSYAGAKEDFIAEVKKQCGKSDGDAADLATPGRSGNVVKWKTCTGATVAVGDCTLNCSDSSSKIGK